MAKDFDKETTEGGVRVVANFTSKYISNSGIACASKTSNLNGPVSDLTVCHSRDILPLEAFGVSNATRLL